MSFDFYKTVIGESSTKNSRSKANLNELKGVKI